MKTQRLRWMMTICMATLVAGAGKLSAAQESDGDVWGDPEISAAVEKVRKGEGADLMRLTSKTKPKSSWKPEKKNLPKYHECLSTNENPRVQFFAVAAISRLKDKSSVEPLQKFIVSANRRLQEGTISHEEESKEPAKAAQRRQKGGLLSREESVMLQLALGVAMEALGEIDDDSDLSVKFLGNMLKNDMGKEWGGGVAHSALAKKGAPGLRRLLEESLTADGVKYEYLCKAIREVRDPALFGTLSAACLDPKYSERVGGAALSAIANMRGTVPEAEQFVLDILMKDEKSNLRLSAVGCVAQFGTEKGFKILHDLRNAPGKGGDELVQRIDFMVNIYDFDNKVKDMVNAILAQTTPDEEKIRLCRNIGLMGSSKYRKHVAAIEPCLHVTNGKGEPLNEARVVIWGLLYNATETKYPLTLAYENDKQFKRTTDSVKSVFIEEYRYKSKVKYPYEQHEKLADEATKQMVKKWVKDNTEKTGGKK
jgi:hypothetical protein